MPQQPNQNQESERLRAVVNDESLSPEQRDIAAKLLAELEKPRPATPAAILEQVYQNIDRKVAEHRAEQLENYKVCSACCLKQPKANDRCELCGTSGKWESPLPESLERQRCIAATTRYSNDELNNVVATFSMHTDFVEHCVRVLALRGVPRVRSFWEGPGLDIHGRRLESDPPKKRTAPAIATQAVTPSAGVSYTGH